MSTSGNIADSEIIKNTVEGGKISHFHNKKYLKGKCYIFKRATLYLPDGSVSLIDYSNGILPQDCSNKVIQSDDYPLYIWNLPKKTLYIPLNVYQPVNVDSFYRTGTIQTEEGIIKWEYIFGRYKTHFQYHYEYLIFYLIIIFLVFLLLRR